MLVLVEFRCLRTLGNVAIVLKLMLYNSVYTSFIRLYDNAPVEMTPVHSIVSQLRDQIVWY